ncbi:MAG: hypothetical protein QXJ06_03075 [Candidatus Aenigmatarchaeota archaeon]
MQKKIMLFFFLIVFIPIVKSDIIYVCCKDRYTYQERCYATGECCNGKWYERCLNFEVWTRDTELTIGVPSPVNVYIRNTGAYDDTYTLGYKIIEGKNIILVDTKGQTTINVNPSEIRVLQPKVILLATPPNPVIIEFTVYSEKDPNLSKTTILRVSGESMYSMSEFSFIFLLLLTFSSIFVYRKV